MGIKCRLILDNQTVYAGTSVTGIVHYELNSAETFNSIKLTISGNALIKYRVGKSQAVQKENFFNLENLLFNQNDGQKFELTTGTHTERFSVILPLNLPSSYKYWDGTRGIRSHIEYVVKVCRPTTLWNHKDDKSELIVIKYCDLNLIPELAKEAEINISKTFFQWWCNNFIRPVYIKFCLPRSGFVPGTKIPFSLDCNNSSSHKVKNINVSLRLIIKYNRLKPGDPTSYQKLGLNPTQIILSEISLGSVCAGEAKIWNENILIPSIQAFHSDGCKIIDMSYIIYVKVKFSFPHRKLLGQLPIILGDVHNEDQLANYEATIPTNQELKITLIKDLKNIQKYKIKKDTTDMCDLNFVN